MPKVSVGGWFFDAVLKLTHDRGLVITDHPVEEGANITDHSYVRAKTLTLEIGMSDVGVGGFETRQSRSVSAFEILSEMQEKREPVDVVTRLDTYKNMLIEDIKVDEDNTTTHGLRASVFLREVKIVSAESVMLEGRPVPPPAASASPAKTNSSNAGAVRPQPAPPAVDRSGANALYNLL